jgi:K+-transporting ATPase ATPase C chain
MTMKHLRPAIVLAFVLLGITGLLYPGAIAGLGQLLFPHQARGSLVEVEGRIVGSELIGQSFTQPHYFHGRPSAAGAGYDAAASGGSNKGPTDGKLADTLIAGAVAEAARLDNVRPGAVPADRATRSASGLDPHISPANAEQQVARVAAARRVAPDQIRAVVHQHTQGRVLGFLGDPRVNVLMLNLALDQKFGGAE